MYLLDLLNFGLLGPFCSCSLSELFSPGKLDVGSRWKPPTGSEDGEKLSGAPKRKFKSLDEVLQNENAPGKHITYHVPPGMTSFFTSVDWSPSLIRVGVWGPAQWGQIEIIMQML